MVDQPNMTDEQTGATYRQLDAADAQGGLPFVSVIIPTLNEQAYIPELFEGLRAQDYPHDRIELLFVDGQSVDKTRALIEERIAANAVFVEPAGSHVLAESPASADPAESPASAEAPAPAPFAHITLLENPRHILSTALNIGITNAQADLIIKLDAHAFVPPEFISRRVALMRAGEQVGGGPWFPLIDKPTPWKRTLLAGEQSVFGSSVADYRRKAEPAYVSSISHGIYHRAVFAAVGLFDEKLRRTEDNEFHYRVRRAGYRIRFEPEAFSYHHMRSGYRSLLKQKYGNGFWVGRTLLVQRHCLRLFHLVPAVFVLALIAAALVIEPLGALPLLALAVVYLVAALGATVLAAVRSEQRNFLFVALPFVFLSMHIAYGAGTLIGLVVGFIKGNRR